MKRNEITKAMQEEVKALIDNGYTIALDELSGSYSDVLGAQVVFAKGLNRVIMWQERVHTMPDEPEAICLRMAAIELPAGQSLETRHRWPTDWAAHTRVEALFYNAAGRYTEGWWVSDRAEAEACMQLRHQRRAAKGRSCQRKELEVTDRLLSIARRQKGFKTIKAKDLAVCKSTGRRGTHWTFTNRKSGNQAVLGGAR